MPEEMVIFTRMFDLLDWLLPKAERFPKIYRSTVTQRLMNAALDLQEALFDAHSQGGTTRQKHLRSADAALDKLRLYLRLAHRWQWLNEGQYQHVSALVAEIGRLLGGWMNQTTHYSKPDVVVTIVRIVVVANRRPRIVVIVVPRAAPGASAENPR